MAPGDLCRVTSATGAWKSLTENNEELGILDEDDYVVVLDTPVNDPMDPIGERWRIFPALTRFGFAWVFESSVKEDDASR